MSKTAKRPVQRKKNAGVSRSQLVLIEPDKMNRQVARKTYKSYKRAEKKPGAFSKAGSALGAGLGSAFGPAGTGVGSFLGGKLGHLIETVTGFGDYHVDNNTVLTGGMSPPQVVNSVEKGGVIIRHREFIGDIAATVNFTIQSYLIQPGLADTFPWLSQIANGFEQYRLRGMLFEFKSTASDAVLSTATSSALGTVMMMTEYDIADAIPSGKRQMLNAEYSSSSKPSCSFIHPIECKKSLSAQNILYTRGAIAPPANFDQRLYDFARFHIATEGMQAASGLCGELWVTYEIELLKPQLAYFGFADHYITSLVTSARPLGTVVGSNIARGGTIGGVISGAGTDYSFPFQVSSGQYYFSYTVIGGGATLVFAPNVTLTNATFLPYWTNNAFVAVSSPLPAVVANQTTYMVQGTFRIDREGASIQFSNTGVPPGATMYGDLWVMRLPDSIST